MMKTANLEKITVLNRKQASDRWSQAPVTALGDMMSIFRQKKSAYEEQKRPNR